MASRLRYDDLPSEPTHVAQACPALSRPLVHHLARLLPPPPALVLSVGCGSGLLEALLLEASLSLSSSSSRTNLVGVEVEGCPAAAVCLPSTHRVLVPATSTVYEDAVLASALVFVYPRAPRLVAEYLEIGRRGALERLVWFSHRTDWPAYRVLVEEAFGKVNTVEADGIASYELLILATAPRP